MLQRRSNSGKWVPLALMAASLAALVAAFAGQYLFGLEPCILCLYERVPYAIVFVLAGVALVPATSLRARAMLVATCGAVFMAGAVLAIYHIGIEQHWWSAVTGCAGELPQSMTVESLRAGLSAPARKACDEVDWRLFGISLAGYNALASAVLSAAAFVGARLLFARQRGSR